MFWFNLILALFVSTRVQPKNYMYLIAIEYVHITDNIINNKQLRVLNNILERKGYSFTDGLLRSFFLLCFFH